MTTVAIVGAGIVGSCVAEALERRGASVVLLERGGPARDAASFGNAGIVATSHYTPLAAPGVVGQGLRWMLHPESPFYLRLRLDKELIGWAWRFMRSATHAHVELTGPLLADLHARSRRLYPALLASLGGRARLVERGLMVLCQSEPGLAREAASADRGSRYGVRSEVLDAATVRSRYPGVRVEALGAVFYPDDAHVSPRAVMEDLQAHLERRGVRFEWHFEVVHIDDRRDTVVIRAADGRQITADVIVVAAGVWSGRLARTLGCTMPLQGGRGYNFTVPQPAPELAVPAILSEPRIAMTPQPDGLRFGGTMEITDPSQRPRPRRVYGIVKGVGRFFPDLAGAAEAAARQRVWSGFRPLSPDGMPYLGRLSTKPRVVIASGHGMNGLSLGPVTGELVSQIIDGSASETDLALLDPERFARRRRREGAAWGPTSPVEMSRGE